MQMPFSHAKVLQQEFIANAPDGSRLDWTGSNGDGSIQWLTNDLKELKRALRTLHADLTGTVECVTGGWLDYPIGEVIRSLKESKPASLKGTGKRLVSLG